jgi:HSP20 family protein
MNRFYDDLIRQMEQELERSGEMLRRHLHSCTSPEHYWEPQIDVYETRDAVMVKAELAGVRPEEIDVELSAEGTTLTLRGIRREERSEGAGRVIYHQMEIYLGRFERVVNLPRGARVDRDAVDANYQSGYLIVTLPKRPPESAVTQVPVSS